MIDEKQSQVMEASISDKLQLQLNAFQATQQQCCQIETTIEQEEVNIQVKSQRLDMMKAEIMQFEEQKYVQHQVK